MCHLHGTIYTILQLACGRNDTLYSAARYVLRDRHTENFCEMRVNKTIFLDIDQIFGQLWNKLLARWDVGRLTRFKRKFSYFCAIVSAETGGWATWRFQLTHNVPINMINVTYSLAPPYGSVSREIGSARAFDRPRRF
jgi:hypothetical protein